MNYDIQWPNAPKGDVRNTGNPYLYIIDAIDTIILGTGKEKDLFMLNPGEQVTYPGLKHILEVAYDGKSEPFKKLDEIIQDAEMTDEERDRKREYDFWAAPSRVYDEY